MHSVRYWHAEPANSSQQQPTAANRTPMRRYLPYVVRIITVRNLLQQYAIAAYLYAVCTEYSLYRMAHI